MASPETTTDSDPSAPATPAPAGGPVQAPPDVVSAAGPMRELSGVPYHLLGARLPRRWWRLGIPLVVFVMVQVVMSVAVALGSLLPERGIPVLGRHTQLAVLFAGIAACLPLLALYVRRTRRPFGTLGSVAGRLRAGWLGLCLVVGAGPLVAFGVLAAVVRWRDFVGWDVFAPTMAALLPLLVLAVVAEEYVSRGFVLQTVGSLFASPWPGILVQAVLFGALHGLGTVWGMLDLLVYATALGWLTVRTGGLEAAIALHIGQNVMAAIGDVALLPAHVTQAATDQTIADAPWLGVLLHLGLIVPLVVGLERLAALCNIARTTPTAPTATAAAARDGAA
ncbi:CPBP family intramembrane metalloprotease [Micromonospora sp. CPCC 205371]|nr:CPBP family intramembrane metalloprotease [Micromonospora sp. CPCC 205371]